MTDFRFSDLDSGLREFDLLTEDNDIATDDGLDNAVAISLFTDRRAPEEIALPEGETDRRGWWGDEFYEEDEEDEFGSLLWLLAREKASPEVLNQAETYAEEALEWLKDDGVASEITVGASIDSGTILLSVSIVRPTGDTVDLGYHLNWERKANPGAIL